MHWPQQVLLSEELKGIFRFWNLRALGCDWLSQPHDNLGRNCSCVLSPSVSLEGGWGGFGGLGHHLTLISLVSKERKIKHKLSIFSTSCMAFHLLGLLSFASSTTQWIQDKDLLRNKECKGSAAQWRSNQTIQKCRTWTRSDQAYSWMYLSCSLGHFFLFLKFCHPSSYFVPLSHQLILIRLLFYGKKNQCFSLVRRQSC